MHKHTNYTNTELQMGFVSLTTSRNPAHQQSNLALAEDSKTTWRLAAEDMEALASLAAAPHFTMGIDLSGARQ